MDTLRKSSKPRIAVIFTGGTIGSTKNREEGFYDVSDDKPEEKNKLIDLLIHLKRDIPLKYELVLEDPKLNKSFKKLSENIIPTDWGTIAQKIASAIDQGVDGVVITHGTDTMAYTCSAISFMLSKTPVPIPIVFTGSLIPATEENTDAINNLYDSIIFAAESKISGIFVVFRYALCDNFMNDRFKNDEAALCSSVIWGNRVRSIDEYSQNFYSADHKFLTFIKDGKFNIAHIEKYNLRSDNFKKIVLMKNIEPKIAFFKIYPGFDPNWIAESVKQGYKGIILELYHSATACTDAMDSYFPIVESIKRCAEFDIPIFGVPSYEYTMSSEYITTKKMRDAGLVFLAMSPEAAITKLMWLLHPGNSDPRKDIREKMKENISGEILN